MTTLNQDVFARRRDRFLTALDGGVAIIPAARETIRNNDVSHDFRQDSDFFFLTGFSEPDSVAVFRANADKERYVLFVRPRDREAEVWTGRRAGIEGAVGEHKADAAFPLAELDAKLREWLRNTPTLHYALGNAEHDARVKRLLAQLRGQQRRGHEAPRALIDPRSMLHEMRVIKTADDLTPLREACRISRDAHIEGMRATSPGQFEWQLQAIIEYAFRRRGSPRNGYSSIVASGANACVLHYVANSKRMQAGELVCVDAGAELDYFSADITRTWPISGTFTDPQRRVYEIVLAAQLAAIDAAKPGATYESLHHASRRVIAEGLCQLGLLPRSVEESIKMHHYREFFMHGTGHWLGMDVHDAGRYRVQGKSRPLEPGMVLTVEPGIYIAPEREEVTFYLREYDEDERSDRRFLLGGEKAKALEKEEEEKAEKVAHRLPAQYLGIGIRIEDDVLITESGHEVLTAGTPKTIEEVEATMREAPSIPIA